MRAAAIDYRSETEAPKAEKIMDHESLLTPARRAGLEALERELSEFLKLRPR